MVNFVPDGCHTVMPYLSLKDAATAIEWYKDVFEAEEVTRMPGPDGTGVLHAELRISGSMIMLSDECPVMEMAWRSPQTLEATTVAIFLYVPDADAMFDKAVSKGARSMEPMSERFWGDRMGQLKDPFGHHWTLATHVKDLSPEEMQKAAAEAMAAMTEGQT